MTALFPPKSAVYLDWYRFPAQKFSMADNWQDQMNYSGSAWPEICGHTFYAPPLRMDDFRENGLVIDLGGSSGPFSNAVINLFGGLCHVLEAATVNFNQIEETDRLKRHHHAIAGEEGPAQLWLAENEVPWGSTEQLGQFNYSQSEEVEGITLSGLLKKIDAAHVDLLKIDIEGAEFDMFRSTPDELLTSISQITIEFHDFMDAKYIQPVQDVKQRLTGLGFTCFVFTRHYNGDVLFINNAHLKLSLWQRFEGGIWLKYSRGLRRLLARL